MNRKLCIFTSILFFLTYSLCFGKPPILITLTAPQDGTFVNKTVPIEAQIGQLPRVKSVKFYIDNKLVGESDTAPYQYTWDTTTYPDGQHQTYASILQAPDRPEPFDEASMTVLDSPRTNLTVDNTPPQVSITAPSNASFITGSITTQAQVTDNLGISKVEFKVDSILVKEFTQPPYNYQWDTKTTQDGLHTFEATAYDLANNKTSSSVSFTVDNSPPTAPVVIDDGNYTNSLNTLHASWSSQDPGTGISGYQYSIGTTVGSTDILNWVSVGTNTEISLTNMSLQHGKTYYFNVKAINGVGLVSSVGSSDGIMVNAHIPQITRVIPNNNSTFYIGSEVIIEVSAQDLDSDPLEYQFSLGGQIKQPWSSLNTFGWSVQNSESNTQQFTIQVRDDKGGFVSENVTYNVQIAEIDTTPPAAPIITVGGTSNSLNSISASWISEDPESGIVEYQYAIGTTPGGTDVLYWTSYGANTEAPIYGLNLAEGQNYYISVVAKNGTGLKSQPTTSSAIKATKELYVKITSPQNNALITENECPIKGIAEGVTQVTINGKPVNVNPDGNFTGPTLVAPGYAKMNNISDDDSHIIMRYQSSTDSTHTLPTVIGVSANGIEQDSITVYCYQLYIKLYNYREFYYLDENGNEITSPWFYIQQYNSSLFQEPPFNDWPDSTNNRRYHEYWYPENYYEYWYDPTNWSFYEVIDFPSSYVSGGFAGIRGNTLLTLHSPPATVKQFVILFKNIGYVEGLPPEPIPLDVTNYKINGQPLRLLFGNEPGSVYAVFDNNQPDTDFQLTLETPDYGTISWEYHTFGEVQVNKYFNCNGGIDLVKLDVVREVPYNSGDYVPTKATPIFQPDDGKGRGPSLELVNMPFLKLKFDQEPSDLQTNTLEAKLSIADETKTYNLTETTPDSSIFTDSSNSFSVVIPAEAGIRSGFNPNLQDETTCSVTSTFGNFNNRLFNLKESASDSLYFNDIKTFVTLIFNNELLPYQNDTLTIQYDNGMLASEETLTETSPESLIFSNEDKSFSVRVNNYSGALSATIDITINNTDYLEISKAELILPKVNPSAYVYTNEPMDGGSDLPPNNPLDEGQGVFRIRVEGLSSGYLGVPPEALQDLNVTISGGISTQTPPLTLQQNGSYMTDKLVLLPGGNPTTYDGITNLYAINNTDKWDATAAYGIESKDNEKPKGAFVGIPTLSLFDEFAYNVTGGLMGIRTPSTSEIAMILERRLGYTKPKFDVSLTEKEFLEALPNYSVWYTTSHGFVPNFVFKGIKVSASSSREGSATVIYPDIIFPADVSGAIGGNSYKLVFINACLSGDENPNSNTNAFIAAFNAGKYMGWKIASMPMPALLYSKEFFNRLDGKNRETQKPKTIDEVYLELYNADFTYARNINCKGPKDDTVDRTP